MGPQADAKAAAKQVNAVKEVGRTGLGRFSRRLSEGSSTKEPAGRSPFGNYVVQLVRLVDRSCAR